MKYKVTFPDAESNNHRLAQIRCLRNLIPGLGLKEASDMTRCYDCQLLTLGYYGQDRDKFYAAFNELVQSGVAIQAYDNQPCSNEPESQNFEKQEEQHTIVQALNLLAQLAIKRGEYELAEKLVAVLKHYEIPVFISGKAAQI